VHGTRLLLPLLAIGSLAACKPGDGTSRGGPTCDLPDYDKDWIADVDEGSDDPDGDHFPNGNDTDADGDGLFDATEAGDTDPCTTPRDTDGDGRYDFLDEDSDGDGLSDRDENETTRTDPTNPDTDGDGFDDGVETVAGTDPNDPESRIAPEDFYIVLPYEDPLGPYETQLSFGTNLERADVFFLVDTSASMGDAIRNVQDGLVGEIVPGLEAAVPDVQIGVGEFEDFPVEPYGWDADNPLGVACDDHPFTLWQAMTSDIDAVGAALANLDDPLGCGGDRSESAVEALRQLATGAGLAPWVEPAAECPEDPDGLGPPAGAACFRAGAQPIVVLISDAPMHDGPGGYDPYVGLDGVAAYGDAATALRDVGARVVGVVVDGDPLARTQMERFATDTGTVDADNQPLVFDAVGGDADTQVVDAVTRLVGATPQDISIVITDDPADAFDATRFVRGVAPAHAEPKRDTAGGSFLAVPPGGTVWFRLTFENDLVEAADAPRVFHATITVLGNGVARLDTRNVFIVVPSADGIFVID
jgi:hypothetical protein